MLSYVRASRATIKKILCKAKPAQLLSSYGKVPGWNGVRSLSFFARNGVTREKEHVDCDGASSSIDKVVHRGGGHEKALDMIFRSNPKNTEAAFLKAVSSMQSGGRWNDIENLLEDAASLGLLNDVNMVNVEEVILKCPQFRRMGHMVQSLARYNLQPSDLLVKTAARHLAQTKQLKELLVMVDTLREHKYVYFSI
jgi:hypothetical protein